MESIEERVHTHIYAYMLHRVRGKQFVPFIWIDANDESVLIKEVGSIKDCTIAQYVAECVSFVPRYYGYFEEKELIYRPRYKHPGEFDCTSKKHTYLAMQRLAGYSVDTIEPIARRIDFIRNTIDVIYQHYMTLCDKGIIWRDLYCRNIVVTNHSDSEPIIYFIDFEYANTEIQPEPLSPSLRHTCQQLMDDILSEYHQELVSK